MAPILHGRLDREARGGFGVSAARPFTTLLAVVSAILIAYRTKHRLVPPICTFSGNILMISSR
jgi:hypothetical protein